MKILETYLAYAPRGFKLFLKGVVSKNTNELKTSSPGRFRIDVSTLDWPMGARILGYEHADPVLCQNSALLK